MHHCVYSWVKTVLWTAIESPKLEVALTCVSKTVTVVPAPGDRRMEQRLLPHAERCLRLLRMWTEDKKDSDKIDNLVTYFLVAWAFFTSIKASFKRPSRCSSGL